MKMRDKKKVNRIVKAGLALLCAGALLGGAVFGGGSVRVKAEDGDDSYQSDASEAIKAVYYDESEKCSYILYDNSKNKDISVCIKGDRTPIKTEKLSDNEKDKINTNVYIIWDARESYNADENSINEQDVYTSITKFGGDCKNPWLTKNTDVVKGIKLPYKSDNEIEFIDIKDIDKKYNTTQDDSEDTSYANDTSGQLANTLNTLCEDYIDEDKSGYNIVIIITGDEGYDTSTLKDRQAIVYKVDENNTVQDEDNSYIPYSNWENTVLGEIKNFDCMKFTGEIEKEYDEYKLKESSTPISFEYKDPESGSSTEETTTEITTQEKTTQAGGGKSGGDKDTADYEIVDSQVEKDSIIVLIKSNNTEDKLKDNDVTALLDGEKLPIQKDSSYKGDEGISRWIIEGQFKVATPTDAPNTTNITLEINGEKLIVGAEEAGIIDRFIDWFKESLSHKIVLICGCLILVVLVVFIILIVRINKKRKQGKRRRQGGIPHGSPSSSPDVQLRSGVSPTAQTNVLARRAGEQNMQGMNNTVPANNTKQIQIQIIGRNPKIINTYINGSIFVGRANTCDVFINDATISRQHFALECVNGEVFIQPLVATNGTKLNGQRINDKHPLYPNDRIQIGTIGIVVRW